MASSNSAHFGRVEKTGYRPDNAESGNFRVKAGAGTVEKGAILL